MNIIFDPHSGLLPHVFLPVEFCGSSDAGPCHGAELGKGLSGARGGEDVLRLGPDDGLAQMHVPGAQELLPDMSAAGNRVWTDCSFGPGETAPHAAALFCDQVWMYL